jgi:hypothetical protein
MPPGMIAVQVGSHSRSASRQCRRSLVTQKLSARNHHGHLGATAALRRQYPHSLSEQIFDVAISVREPHMEPKSVPDDHGGKLIAGNRDRYAES